MTVEVKEVVEEVVMAVKVTTAVVTDSWALATAVWILGASSRPQACNTAVAVRRLAQWKRTGMPLVLSTARTTAWRTRSRRCVRSFLNCSRARARHLNASLPGFRSLKGASS
eukprot:3341394-Pleurochrysis_carterae.AAC.2